MAYNSNIPQPADQLKNSQPQILANFLEINTALNVNHVGFNVADEGKHKFLQMPQQGAAPATGAIELGLVNLVGAYSGVAELNFVRQNNGDVIPFTEGLLTTPGWTILPCGLLVKWGTIVIAPGAYLTTQSQVVLYPVAADTRAFTQPALFTLFSDQFDGNNRFSPFAYSINTAVGTNTNLQFNFRYSSLDKVVGNTAVAVTVNWLAVGI